MSYDVAVVGLGPAGATAAYYLALEGFKVIAFDKERFPRYKPCGGCISTKVEGMLDFDISSTVEDTVRGAVFTYRSGREIEILSEKTVGYNVMRDTFDDLIVKKAAAAGAEIVEGCRIKGIAEEKDSVSLKTDSGSSYQARFIIGADGASGFVGRELFGLDAKEAAVSITAEVPYDRGLYKGIEGRLFIDFGLVPYGYAWIFPKKEFLSVGMAGEAMKVRGGIKEYFNTFVETHPLLKTLKVDKQAGWTVPIFYEKGSSLQIARGRVALAGDTGHLVDPFLGEGIYYAIRTAKAAASAVSDSLKSGVSNLNAYQSWVESELYPEFKGAEKMSSLVYNYPRLWYKMLEKEPDIMRRYYDVIRGKESNGSFYKWVCSKIRSKPWKVLRGWLQSRLASA
ncbi:MAG: geranylgeranyl reductase family protein [Thermodesulfobacteriota bacterium]